MMASTPLQSPHKDFSATTRRRSSVKSLLSSANPPASPLDALVMALEATVEDVEEGFDLDFEEDPAQVADEDEDPDATIPSSPTMFMRGPANYAPSLHHLPSMLLPSPASNVTGPVTATAPRTPKVQQQRRSSSKDASAKKKQGEASLRKMSISSEDSASSNDSVGGGGLRFTCSAAHCEKRFSQPEQLVAHER